MDHRAFDLFFRQLLDSRLAEHNGMWLSESVNQSEIGAILSLFVRASRNSGKDRIVLNRKEQEFWLGLEPGDLPFFMQLDELVRALFLFRIEELAGSSEALIRIVEDLYYTGDNEEKRALLRAFPYCSSPSLYHKIAVEACRTNVVSIFSGIACESPFPFLYFSEMEFNQMIIKGLTLGLDLPRVYRWKDRNNAELERMSQDYVREREAAGRSYPEGNRLIIEDYRSKK